MKKVTINSDLKRNGFKTQRLSDKCKIYSIFAFISTVLISVCVGFLYTKLSEERNNIFHFEKRIKNSTVGIGISKVELVKIIPCKDETNYSDLKVKREHQLENRINHYLNFDKKKIIELESDKLKIQLNNLYKVIFESFKGEKTNVFQQKNIYNTLIFYFVDGKLIDEKNNEFTKKEFLLLNHCFNFENLSYFIQRMFLTEIHENLSSNFFMPPVFFETLEKEFTELKTLFDYILVLNLAKMIPFIHSNHSFRNNEYKYVSDKCNEIFMKILLALDMASKHNNEISIIKDDFKEYIEQFYPDNEFEKRINEFEVDQVDQN
ncbi:hypothetical protein A0H76_475 [Hepatospora eriocheir]|uniref:Uncharacterized protein n=1 Tax=Hepatospora eriocheir TaxID=1081669 RepID=A0A1X0QIN9_9MICR|nr:hypothetical protein A0H76_475 [Hepatospora eriocheir]